MDTHPTSPKDIEFEWDTSKNASNLEKHGISFEEAALVFNDEYKLDLPDIKHTTASEKRRIVIGQIGRVVFVVYTKRYEAIRLISARAANKKEREKYYDNKEKTQRDTSVISRGDQ